MMIEGTKKSYNNQKKNNNNKKLFIKIFDNNLCDVQRV